MIIIGTNHGPGEPWLEHPVAELLKTRSWRQNLGHISTIAFSLSEGGGGEAIPQALALTLKSKCPLKMFFNYRTHHDGDHKEQKPGSFTNEGYKDPGINPKMPKPLMWASRTS